MHANERASQGKKVSIGTHLCARLNVSLVGCVAQW